MTINLRNTILLGACYCSSTLTSEVSAFSTTLSTSAANQRKRPSTALYRSSPGFVGFRGEDRTNRGDGGNNNFENYNNGDSSWEEPYDMRGQVAPSSSNLARRRDSSASSRSYNSVAEEQQEFDYSSRYSQMPYEMMPPHIMQQQRSGGFDSRIQGGSRQTYQDMGRGGQAFVETDGRPLNVEMEMWDGPNNTPSSVKFYSEDGRSRPMNVNTNYNGYGGRGGTMSVRNVGSMEFPMRAGVGPGGGGGRRNDRMMGGGDYGSMGMSSPYDTTPIPSTARGITVQGGSLKTFKLPSQINAAQVTIKSDGLPVNAKVELWGTSSHVKQVAEVYNDNGQTRPFAAIIDVPGEENTIAVRNTGPLEYPIEVVVEPVGMGMEMGMGGMGRGGRMMDGWYGDDRFMMGDGFDPRMRGLPPPPPMMGGPPFMLPPPPPY